MSFYDRLTDEELYTLSDKAHSAARRVNDVFADRGDELFWEMSEWFWDMDDELVLRGAATPVTAN